MTPDSNGILMLEDTDPISPFQVLINGMQAGTSEVLTPVLAGTADTGWVNITSFTAPWQSSGTVTPRVRKIGPAVYVQGTITVASATNITTSYQTVCTLPLGFRPGQAAYFTLVAQTSGNLGVSVATSGIVSVRAIGGTISSFAGTIGINGIGGFLVN